MEWTYQIRAAARPRTLMRLAQLFDQQRLAMQRCLLEQIDEHLDISITLQADEVIAQRVLAKIYKLQDVLHIELHRGRLHHRVAAAVPGENHDAVVLNQDPQDSPTAAG